MDIRTQQAKYVVGDLLSGSIAWGAFNLYRYYAMGISSHLDNFSQYALQPNVLFGQGVVPLAMAFVFLLSGYYNAPLFKSRVQEFFVTLLSVGVIVLGILFAALFDDINIYTPNNYQLLGMLYLLVFSFVYTTRWCITKHATLIIHHRKWSVNALVIGYNTRAIEMVDDMNSLEKSIGYHIVGYVKVPLDKEGKRVSHQPLPTFEMAELAHIIEQHQIKELIIAPMGWQEQDVQLLLNQLFKYNVPLKLYPHNEEMLTRHVHLTNIYGTQLIEVAACPLSECEKNLKRLFDVVVSATVLVLLAPIFVLLAIAIKCNSKGSVFYAQERIGYKQRPFRIYKFRSMVANAEQGTPELSSENDMRITPFGQFMRKYRIDELPQFWNVLKGDMSIVGPRPERAYFIQQIVEYAPYYVLLHQVRPGITSWGMVKYGYARNVAEMVDRLNFDILYLKNMSLIVDFKIIIYTIRTVVTGRGI